MRKLLNILLFGKSFFKEFPAVSIDENAISETVFFEANGIQSDVSDKQWLLSLEPMVFGIWIDNVFDFNEKKCLLHFKSNQKKTMAVLDLSLTDSITEKEGILLLFEVGNTKLYYSGKLKMQLIYQLYYKRPKLSFGQFENLIAAFSYPRKVRLISFKKEEYFNVFPMDLVGNIPGTNQFIFGLRHTNTTLDKIIETRKIVAAEFPSTLKKQVYQLSNHHSGNPPNMDSLPFKTISTQLYGFPIPEMALKYHEIEIKKTLNLGSHILLWGEAMNSVSNGEEQSNLYHIHYLNHLNNSPYKLA